MYCKLDRVLISKEWFSKFPMVETFFLKRSSSDHCPSIIRFFNHSAQGKHVFKYCNFWASDDNFLSLVQQAWNTTVQGTPMYVSVQKLKQVKINLKHLHRTEYSKMSQRIEEKRQLLIEVQKIAQEDPINVICQQNEK